MNYYEIWCNLRDSSKDLEFCEHLDKYLGHLREKGLIEQFAVKRRKLGFGPPGLGEFNITISVRDLAQLEAAFQAVAARSGQIEAFHQCVYAAAKDVGFALYRDFPDKARAS